MQNVMLSEQISPAFYDLHHAVQNHEYTHYWLEGGRGSTKSSFVSLEIPLLMKRYPNIHCVCLRKIKDTLRDSCYGQNTWAIDTLLLNNEYKIRDSDMRMTYLPTQQRILYKGSDDKAKRKSIKIPHGYVGIVWYEELDQFDSMEEIRSINQSLLRGGDKYWVFYTYNPPKSVAAWVNTEKFNVRPDRIIHRSDYRSVPREWLGEQFIIEAELLKQINPQAYAHEYLGEMTGTGGAIFDNLDIRRITDSEISNFDNQLGGIDWGFAIDPFYWGKIHYDHTRRIVYIFDEVTGLGFSNRTAADAVIARGGANLDNTADSAELKSCADFRDYGVITRAAIKPQGSVAYGIKFLQKLCKIVIDPVRCPHAAKEFMQYEYERNRAGEFISRYPDSNNHSIDATRYALERQILLSRGNV